MFSTARAGGTTSLLPFCIILLSSLCAAQTWPFIPTPAKAAYFTSSDLNWTSPSTLLLEAVAQGYNMIYLSYIDLNVAPQDYALAWSDAYTPPAVKQSVVDQMHSVGAKLMLQVRLGPVSGVSPYDKNATALAIGVCNWAKANYFDGVDWYPTAIQKGFISSLSQSADYTVTWLSTVISVSRQQLGNNYIIALDPNAGQFGTIGGDPNSNAGSTGGFTAVYANVGNQLNLLNIAYYNVGNNQGCCSTYSQVFVQSGPSGSPCPANNSVSELNTLFNIPISKIVIGKPVETSVATTSNGYMTAQQIHSCLVSAEQTYYWSTGVALNYYHNKTDMQIWLTTIFPPEVPGIPLSPFSVGATTNAISLQWQYPPYDGFSRIVNYTLLRGPTVIYNGSQQWFNDTGLQKGTLYNYTLYATNIIGTSNVSVPSIIGTLDFPGKPLPPKCSTYNVSTATLSWAAPSYTGNTAITKYVLERNNTPVYTGLNLGYTDTGLAPKTTYSYSLVAWNSVGSSVIGDPTIVITDGTAPGSPTKVIRVNVTETTISIAWNPPDSDGGEAITGYTLMNNGIHLIYQGPLTFCTDEGLVPGTTYEYTVSATNKEGASEFSAPAYYTTATPPDTGGGSSGFPITAIIGAIIAIVVVALIIIFLVWRRRRSQRKYTNQKGGVGGGGSGGRSMSVAAMLKDATSLPLSEFNSSNLITPYEEVRIVRKLGSGGSGYVYVGEWRNTAVAVKEYRDQNIETTDFIRESEIHAKLRHPNVVQLLAICLPPHLCAISEYMTRGSLTDVLEKKPPELTWALKCQMLLDIAKGMDYLIKSRIIHRDLKSQNCLVDRNWCCKIADFGTSKFLVEDATATMYVPRTAQWTAPEVITKNEYSEKSDVYSFGIVMWEVLTGKLPYEGMFAFNVEDRTVKGQRLTIPLGAETWYKTLMSECWHAEPAERPTFDQILKTLQYAVENPSAMPNIRDSRENPAKFAAYNTDVPGINREQTVSYVGDNGIEYATL